MSTRRAIIQVMIRDHARRLTLELPNIMGTIYLHSHVVVLVSLILGLGSLFPDAHTSPGDVVALSTQVNISYGRSLRFVVKGTLPFDVTSAALTVRLLNRESVSKTPVTIAGGANLNIELTLDVGQLELPPVAVITYVWELVDPFGKLYSSEPQNIIYEDTSVPWKWSLALSGRMQVHTFDGEGDLGQMGLEFASEAITGSQDAFNVAISDEIHIYIYPDLASLANALRLHRTGVRDSVAAYLIPDQSTLLVALTGGHDSTIFLKRDITHELWHLTMFVAAGNTIGHFPIWFEEGAALVASDTSGSDLDQALNRALNDRVLLSLNSLCASDVQALSPRNAALAYAQSKSFAQYLMGRFGPSYLRNLADAFVAGKSCDDAVRNAFGISLNDLESQWHTQLSQGGIRDSEASRSPMPWVVVAGITTSLAALFLLGPRPKDDVHDALSNLTVRTGILTDSESR